MPDAVELLREDHRKVQALFRQFEEAEENEGGREIEQIVSSAIKELKVHTELEEELFYPAVRKEIDEEEKVLEAEEEHHVAKLLISELEKMRPDDEHYCAKFQVLVESVKHHIEEEESTMIPEVEDALDTQALGEQMVERKQELEQNNGKKSGRQNRQKKSRGRSKTKKR